jgi:hypothetical protein
MALYPSVGRSKMGFTHCLPFLEHSENEFVIKLSIINLSPEEFITNLFTSGTVIETQYFA